MTELAVFFEASSTNFDQDETAFYVDCPSTEQTMAVLAADATHICENVGNGFSIADQTNPLCLNATIEGRLSPSTMKRTQVLKDRGSFYDKDKAC